MPTPRNAPIADPLEEDVADPQPHEQDDEPVDAEPPEPDADADDGADAEIEARARRAGWIPESEWDPVRAKKEGKAKPEHWQTARQWVDRMEGDNVSLRNRNKWLDGQVRTAQETAASASAKADALAKLVDDLLATQKKLGDRAYAKAKHDIEARMDAAVDQSDTDAYKAAKEGLKQLEEERVETPTPPAPADPPERPQVDPYVATWVKANAWYENDPVARSAATAIHGQLQQEQPELSLRENLAEVRRQIVARFPEHFANPRRGEAPRVSAPSGDRGRGRKDVSFADLTAEQKQIYERQSEYFKSKGEKYTKEQFVEDQLLG